MIIEAVVFVDGAGNRFPGGFGHPARGDSIKESIDRRLRKHFLAAWIYDMRLSIGVYADIDRRRRVMAAVYKIAWFVRH